MRITTTIKIEKIISDYQKGEKITRKKRIFFRNQEGSLDCDVCIALTPDELIEYVKCANDVIYFIEKYCITGFDKGYMVLRGFQKEWINDFNENRFLIYCTSRQTGYSQVMSAVYLHYLIFNNKNKNILLIANKGDTSCEFISNLWNKYLGLPYFLKPGVIFCNAKSMQFNNGNQILSQARCILSTMETIDILSYMEFAHIPPNILDTHYKNSIKKTTPGSSKIIIQSQPNGNNKFIELMANSERKVNDPLKNIFKTIKTYWWEVEGRDEKWKEETIKAIGIEAFNQEYDLSFRAK